MSRSVEREGVVAVDETEELEVTLLETWGKVGSVLEFEPVSIQTELVAIGAGALDDGVLLGESQKVARTPVLDVFLAVVQPV